MRHLSLFIFCILLTNCTTVERDCKAYKTGVFSFHYTVNGVEKEGQFIRTERLNINYFDTKIDSSSVRWINDCEYILKKINPKRMAEKEAIHFKILTTTDSSYTFEYKFAVKKPNQTLRVERGTAYKIN